MYQETTRIITITDAVGSGEGSVVNTRNKLVASSTDRVRLFLNVTTLTGTTPVVTVVVVHVVDGVDINVTIDVAGGTDGVNRFSTLAGGVTSESIVLEACPTDLKVVYTLIAGSITDFDATVDCMRF